MKVKHAARDDSVREIVVMTHARSHASTLTPNPHPGGGGQCKDDKEQQVGQLSESGEGESG